MGGIKYLPAPINKSSTGGIKSLPAPINKSSTGGIKCHAMSDATSDVYKKRYTSECRRSYDGVLAHPPK